MEDARLLKKIGQLFAVGFHGLTPSPEIKTLIHEYGIGGIVIFKRNIADAQQLKELVLALQREARDAGHEHPLFIGIDQENGQVTRITPPIAPQLPGPMALGATHSPELAHAVGRATGETLNVFGINMNYAPVCDVNSEPLNPVVGVRSPGDDPEFVGRFASAAAGGLREINVVPCVKHFPGHGDTAVDSHFGLPVIPKTRDQLERCELIPFHRAVAEGIESIMTAHIALPGIGDEKLPATLSEDALNILRKEMKYDGMVITDCMEMDGIRATFGTEKGTVRALNAGCDSVMICHTFSVQVASILKVREAVESGIISQSRLDEACQRVARLKSKMLSWDRALKIDTLSQLGDVNIRSEALARETYSQSVTLVRDLNGTLPLSRASRLAFLFPGTKTPAGGAVDGEGEDTPGTYHVGGFSNLLCRHNPEVSVLCYGQDGLSKEQWEIVDAAEAVILLTLNARESPFQQALASSVSGRARNLVAVAACNPYDFLEDSTIGTYLATYEPTVESFEAATNIIFGVSPAKGALPVGRKSSTQSVSVTPFVESRDLQGVAEVWMAALPTYKLSRERLKQVLVQPNGHHFVARAGSAVAGFCLAYTTQNRNVLTGQIAVVAVKPENQKCGVGTALLTEARSFFRTQFQLTTLGLTSCFPRFWPGIPRDLPHEVQDFFTHRGFRLSPANARSVDLYQDIRAFQPPQKYLDRAQEKGYKFSPLRPEHYEECLVAQRRNFSAYPGWVETYETLNPQEHPDSVMVAFNSDGIQVGWTLMLSPSSPVLLSQWALPPLCGPQTGLIGAVGVDAAHRNGGIGLALLCHAIMNMKARGIEGAFVDWVSLDGWYEQLGFEVWRSYRPGEI